MRFTSSMLLGFLATASVASTTAAEVFSVIYGEPDFDRWMYPYNGTPGTRIAGPTFGGPYAEIDDRYGQSFCGFVTVDIPVDLPPSAYRVISMSMDIPIINDVVIICIPNETVFSGVPRLGKVCGLRLERCRRV